MALKYFHQPYVQRVIDILKKKGIRFHFNHTVKEIISNVEIDNPEAKVLNVASAKNSDENLRDPESKIDNRAYEKGFTVILDDGESITGDYVVAAMGRTANVEDIGLEKAVRAYEVLPDVLPGRFRHGFKLSGVASRCRCHVLHHFCV